VTENIKTTQHEYLLTKYGLGIMLSESGDSPKGDMQMFTRAVELMAHAWEIGFTTHIPTRVLGTYSWPADWWQAVKERCLGRRGGWSQSCPGSRSRRY